MPVILNNLRINILIQLFFNPIDFHLIRKEPS